MLREITPFGQIKQAAGPGAGTELDFVSANTIASSPITVTTEATAAVVLTGNNVPYDGSRVKIILSVPLIQISVTGARFVLLRDGVVISQLVISGQSYYQEYFDTPPAGNHIYSVKAFTNGANNLTLTAGPGGPGNVQPAYMRVIKA